MIKKSSIKNLGYLAAGTIGTSGLPTWFGAKSNQDNSFTGYTAASLISGTAGGAISGNLQKIAPKPVRRGILKTIGPKAYRNVLRAGPIAGATWGAISGALSYGAAKSVASTLKNQNPPPPPTLEKSSEFAPGIPDKLKKSEIPERVLEE